MAGAVVEILALPDNGLLHYGQFHINLAAGLEDDLIKRIDPEWNGGKVEEVSNFIADEHQSKVLPPFVETFSFVLQPTYYQRGFFNVPVAGDYHFAGHNEQIEIFLGDQTEPLLGTINRTANTNETPRILVGPALKDWFHSSARSK